MVSLRYNITLIELHQNTSYSHNTQIIIEKNVHIFFSPSIRMSENSIKSGDEKVDKSDFYKNKKNI